MSSDRGVGHLLLLVVAVMSSPTRFCNMILNMTPECVASELGVLTFLEIL